MFQRQAGNRTAPLRELSIGGLRTPLSQTRVFTILETFGCQQLTRLDLFDLGDDRSPSRTLSQIASTFPTLESLTLLSDKYLCGWPGELVSHTLFLRWIAQRGETDTTFTRENDCIRSLQRLSSLRFLCWNNVAGWEPRGGNLDALPSDLRNTWLFNTADPLAVKLSSLQEIKFAAIWTSFCNSCIIARYPKPSIHVVESSLDFLNLDWLARQDI